VICRMWHGRTSRANADEYARFLARRAIPDYQSIPGNVSAAVLRCDDVEATHFITLTYWESEPAIRAFAGDEVLTAKYYPEDQGFLLEFEPRVRHFVVVAASAPVPLARAGDR
jgi:heme-degrading monooxygenase HmoA